jgi:hypothetical protein
MLLCRHSFPYSAKIPVVRLLFSGAFFGIMFCVVMIFTTNKQFAVDHAKLIVAERRAMKKALPNLQHHAAQPATSCCPTMIADCW